MPSDDGAGGGSAAAAPVSCRRARTRSFQGCQRSAAADRDDEMGSIFMGASERGRGPQPPAPLTKRCYRSSDRTDWGTWLA